MSHTSRRLTPRPRVPVLVHVAALGLVGVPACGDDGNGETNATTVATTMVDDGLDDHPTACHDTPSCDGFLDTGIESTGTGTGATGTSGSSTDATGTGPLPDDTSSTSGDPGTGTSGTETDSGSSTGSAG